MTRRPRGPQRKYPIDQLEVGQALLIPFKRDAAGKVRPRKVQYGLMQLPRYEELKNPHKQFQRVWVSDGLYVKRIK